MKNKTKLSAFTLIELLIVIAIIGILAGLMAGGISAAMDAANATTLGNNGRNIVQAILQVSNDRQAIAKSTLWPSKDKYKTSNEYFAKLMNDEVLEGVTFQDFAGGGVTAASTAENLKTGDHCAWSMLAGVDTHDSSIPFMWTRNLADLDTEHFKGGENPKALPDLKDIKPFGTKRIVLVRKGGGVFPIKAKLLDAEAFLNNASNTVDSLQICEAVMPGEGETTDSDY